MKTNSNKKMKNTEWSKDTDKRLAEIKKIALKNGNHMIFAVTSEDEGKTTKVTGIFNCHKFSIVRATEMFLESVPDEAVNVVLTKKMLGNLGGLLSGGLNNRK